jgi:hypothetical protein
MSTAEAEVLELRALVDQAWELRGTPYLLDACQAITDWHERRHLRGFERRQAHVLSLRMLLRECQPGQLRLAPECPTGETGRKA